MNQTKYNTELKNTPVQYIKGVGEARARLLAKLGIHSVLDLMELFPRLYISRSVNPRFAQLEEGDMISLTANISWIDEQSTTKGKKVLNLGVNDGDVGIICKWFKYPRSYLQSLIPGRKVWLSGMISAFNGQLQLVHPDFEVFEGDDEELDFWQTRKLLPVYPLTTGFTQKTMRRIIHNAFESYAGMITENLPQEILDKHGFESRRNALQIMHFGQDEARINQTRRRFAYEEFFYAQILWARHLRHRSDKSIGNEFENKKELTSALKQRLPYELTTAQKRVIREIFTDMGSKKQMSRLLQGDVGSGKTIVTLFAMLLAVENGFQAAIMAPTEILAEQHYQNFQKLLEGMPIEIVLIKGGNYKGKAADKAAMKEGSVHLAIGTHALIQKDVEFARLGFIAIDEQHRFGVEQRAELSRKNGNPDMLYLSATPIPRSLAITVYGDLEVSRIDELPPNRKKVLTYVRSAQTFNQVLSEVEKQLKRGRQAYFVCPLIEESDKIDLLDAERLFKYLSEKAFPKWKVELMHGRMTNQLKDETMQRFKAGETHILVSTTVIEVGVDVPNASVMVIEHAERFGIAQLHQLRGRVGRGDDQAYCYLVEHYPRSNIARERLSIMRQTNDGFVIAEKDLELRGPGEIFGREQSGLPQFRFANLVLDQDILAIAREDAVLLIDKDPQIIQEKNKIIKDNYLAIYKQKEELINY